VKVIGQNNKRPTAYNIQGHSLLEKVQSNAHNTTHTLKA